MTDAIRTGLAAPTGRLRKIAAVLLPASVFRRPRSDADQR